MLIDLRRVTVAAIAVLATSASLAHVTVSPSNSTVGAYEKYTVRVPTEGNVATVSVELTLPPGVTFLSVGAPLGHTYELKKSADRVVAIVWSMQINPHEFAEFELMVRNPKEPSDLVWKAEQKFADGSTRQWSGPKGDKHPASVTTIAVGTNAHSH